MNLDVLGEDTNSVLHGNDEELKSDFKYKTLMVLTLDGSQAVQHRRTGLRTGPAAEQTPPSIM